MLTLDTVRLGAFTALVLVVVIAFGASIKHLADGKIDLWGAVLVTVLAIVPMLQFALPFAGGFGATLAYHRFASENEATAAMSGGISHRSLLAPACLVGVLLLGSLLVLSNRAIPSFLRRMHDIVVGDVSGILERTVDRGESIALGPMLIHADRMTVLGQGGGAFDRFHLEGVLAVMTSEPGDDVEGFLVADRVNVWLFDDEGPDGPMTTAQLEFRGVTGNWPGRSLEYEGFFTERVPLPRTFRDDPKFMSYADLARLAQEPRRFPLVERNRRRLAHALSQKEMIEGIRARLGTEGRCLLVRPGGERVVIGASGLAGAGTRWRLVPTPGERVVRIVRVQQGLSEFTQLASDAWLELTQRPHAELVGEQPAQAGVLGGIAGDDVVPAALFGRERDGPPARGAHGRRAGAAGRAHAR